MKKFLVLLVTVLGISGCAQTSGVRSAGDQKPVRLYLVRHGKTIFNTTSQVQGWSDTPLTDVGVAGAVNAGKGLSDITFVSAYTSDMGRARQTAKIILEENKKGAPQLIELPGIREWFYGGFEGRNDADMWGPIFKKYGLEFDLNWSQWGQFAEMLGDRGIANAVAEADPTKTAENYDQIVLRTTKAVNQIIEETEKKGGGNVLVVTHGSEIPTILDIFAPGAYKGEDIKNNSVTIMVYDGSKYTVEAIGDNSYTEKGKNM